MVETKISFSEPTNNITTEIDNRINVLNENLRQCKNHGTLSSPVVRTALDQINKNFVVVPIDKETNNVALIYERFYAFVTIKELGQC